jgi:UDP-glucose:tetrahydrobiopterin glucosyltransferase
MRIALVASLVSPIREAAANGPHAVILDLARGLTGLGHSVVVYAAAGSEADGVELREIAVEPIVADATVRPGGRPSPEATRALNRAFGRLFGQLRRDRPDVVSQHAFDAAAIELAEDLPVLHTLHLPPIVPEVVSAARATRAPLATVSDATKLT